METAIRWSPSSTLSEQRFLIADVKDRFFKRCRVEEYNGKILRHKVISTQNKAPGFRAFDWAPHDETLVAVGSWSGEMTILHIDDSLPNISLPAKRQRLCNAVSFSRTGLLAAGLEGIRNDFSLNLWDINQRLPFVMSLGSGVSRSYVEPYRKFASSEAISSIKFFSGQPEVFVAGIKSKGIRIYDLRENNGNPSLLFKTDAVFNIAIDPLDENYFACAGLPDERSIQIWDCRSGVPAMTGPTSDTSSQAERPVLEYKNVFGTPKSAPRKSDGSGVMVSTIWSLRYCKGKSGCLGALASTGDFKIFETKNGYSSGGEEHTAAVQLDNGSLLGDDSSMLTKRIHQVECAFDDVHKGRSEKERIVAFDFTNLASSKGTPSIITLRGDHSVGIVELNGAPSALGVSSLGDIVVSRSYETIFRSQGGPNEDDFISTTLRKFEALEEEDVAGILSKVHLEGSDASTQAHTQRLSSRQLHERFLQVSNPGQSVTIPEALTLSTITRHRCSEGYLFDCKRNLVILRDDPWLQRLWNWIDSAYCDSLMTVTNGTD